MVKAANYTAAARQQGKTLRLKMLAAIHIAKKELALDDDTYRDLLETRYNKRSSAKLSVKQLMDLIEHFKGLGFKAKKAPPKRAKAKKLADDDLSAKIRALWISLYHLGVVRDPAETALSAFVKRMAQVDALQWMDGEDAYKVIEALKGMATREANVNWGPYLHMMQSIPADPRKRVIEAQVNMVTEGIKAGHCSAGDLIDALEPIGGQFFRLQSYKPTPLDQVIENLGRIVREVKGKA